MLDFESSTWKQVEQDAKACIRQQLKIMTARSTDWDRYIEARAVYHNAVETLKKRYTEQTEFF